MSSRTGSGPSSSRKSIDASMFDPPTAAELAGLDNAGANASDGENDTTSSGAAAPVAADRAASSVGGAESEREPDEEDGGSSAGDGELDREILSKTVLRRGLSDIQRAADGGYAFTRLDLSGQGVKTLEGDLASYPELKYLNLSSNELLDLSPLSALPTLLSLNVSYNSLGSLDSLLPCRHDQLQLLQADHNDIEFLFSKAGGPVAAGSKRSSGAAKASAVASGSNALTHLSSNYPSLFALTLSNNKIASLLRGEDASPASLAALASAPHHSCQILDLAFNQLSNLAGLEAFPELRVLNLQSNALTSLAGVERLKMLEKINVSENKLSQLGVELARLAKLPRLTHLVLTAGNPTLLEELETAFAAAAEAGTASESALAAGVDMTSEILIVLPQLLFLDGKRVGAAARARADATQKDRVADAERRKAEEEEQRKLEEAERKAAAKEAEDEENEDAEKDSDEEEKDEAEADAEAGPDADAEAAQDGAEQDAEAEEDGAADFDGGDDGGDDQAGQSFDEDGQGDDGGDDAAAESFEDDGAAEEEEEEEDQ